MVADGRTVDSEENKNLLRQYHFRTDIFVSSTSEEAAREKARAELDTEQGVKLVLEDVLDLPEYRKEDDELITLPLPRREVAAIILYHLEVVDSYYWSVFDSGADGREMELASREHRQRVDELDGHMTPSLRRWVAGRRDETCRRILLDTPECFVEHATNEHIRMLYDMTFKMRVEEYERPATQKPTG